MPLVVSHPHQDTNDSLCFTICSRSGWACILLNNAVPQPRPRKNMLGLQVAWEFPAIARVDVLDRASAFLQHLLQKSVFPRKGDTYSPCGLSLPDTFCSSVCPPSSVFALDLLFYLHTKSFIPQSAAAKTCIAAIVNEEITLTASSQNLVD